jgi:asparagine synthase (glutamine-hydrolysing)
MDGKGDQHTFSYLAVEPGIDESRYVDIVNRHVGAKGHTTEPQPEELVRDLRELVRVQDYPFGSTSVYAQNRVFRLASEHGVKVMLDGQGADELLAGYSRYLGAYIRQALASADVHGIARTLLNGLKRPDVSARHLLLATGAQLMPRAWHAPIRAMVGEPIVPSWMSRTWVRDRVADPVRTRTGVARGRRALREYMLHELTVGSLPALLRYEDRNSMAFSIEARVPFLTPALASFLFALPDREVLGDGVTKPVLRRGMRGLVPDTILDRRDKIGFATPEQKWLTGRLSDYVRATLESDTAHSIGAIEPGEMLASYERMQSGKERFNFRLWRWLNVIEWTNANGVAWH